MSLPRLVLLSIDSPLSTPAVLRFLDSHGAQIALLALCRPAGPRAAWRALRRSGPRLLPYLAANYGGPVLRPSRLAAAARARGIPVRRLSDANGPVAQAAIRAAAPDLLLTFHCDQILQAATLALAPQGGINVHPALLPAHRGPVPTIWTLAEPAPRWGVTVHRLATRIDAGAILAQAALPLPPGISATGAARALHLAALPLLAQALAAIAAGAPDPPPPAALPYETFPPARLLRELSRTGRRLVTLTDLATSPTAD